MFDERYVMEKLLLETPDDVALAVTCALDAPFDLLYLSIACRRYRAKTVTGAAGGAAGTWSLVEEAARRWLAACTEAERKWVPKRAGDCWLGLMYELRRLRVPVRLSRAHSHIALREPDWRGGASGELGRLASRDRGAAEEAQGIWRTAASRVPMRAGRHFVQIRIRFDDWDDQHPFDNVNWARDISCLLGLVRPGWDVEGGWVVDHVYGERIRA